VVRIASYNVESLFARPKALNVSGGCSGRPILEAYKQVNALMAEATYTQAIKDTMIDLLLRLDVYYRNAHGAVRRRNAIDPQWASLRTNRGAFDLEPDDSTRSIEIVAGGRTDWIGWVELQNEAVDELATRMTARVISELNADVLAVIEVEDRRSLARFNRELLGQRYDDVMLIDGNDERGIEVGIMTRPGFPIGAMRSHVKLADAVGTIFSRDCPLYEVRTPGGATLHVLINHFQSQSGGGDAKRARQAAAVRGLVDRMVGRDEHVIVLGDLNEGPPTTGAMPANLAPLFERSGPLVSCYDLPGFATGTHEGTYDACSLRTRFDYILLSRSLERAFAGGAIVRRGLWGSQKARPEGWVTYPEISAGHQSASNHAAVYVDLSL
jgi:endonuclease/exonuclease/phosphatase family metal-dependent hydrolase